MILKNTTIKRPVIIGICAAVIGLILLAVFLKSTYYWRLVDQCIINAIIVIGLNLICGYTGQMHFGPTALTALGAYSMGLLTLYTGLSAWWGLLLAIAVSCLFGIILGYPCMKISGIYLGLTTMAFAAIVRILANNMVNVTNGPMGISNIPGFKLFGLEISTPQQFFYFLIIIGAIMVWMIVRVVNSKWGRVFKAISTEEQAVSTCGISILRMKIIAFVLSSVYMGVAGALYACLMTYITPASFTAEVGYKYLMMMLVGGINSIGGSILGAGLLTILPETLKFMENYYLLMFYLVVFLMAVLRPHGLIDILRSALRLGRKHRIKGGESSL